MPTVRSTNLAQGVTPTGPGTTTVLTVPAGERYLIKWIALTTGTGSPTSLQVRVTPPTVRALVAAGVSINTGVLFSGLYIVLHAGQSLQINILAANSCDYLVGGLVFVL